MQVLVEVLLVTHLHEEVVGLLQLEVVLLQLEVALLQQVLELEQHCFCPVLCLDLGQLEHLSHFPLFQAPGLGEQCTDQWVAEGESFFL